ncbi:hypothetical protein [Paludisphaera rhizosphaerae]|uniref:hypothetical protein n=1 Tax=Paludisphaera rhizosphaerae TaxID=2711216 RepID=UPI0013EE17AC|nr:hypothetical protein [Paludisphaera rhizosphaerae]
MRKYNLNHSKSPWAYEISGNCDSVFSVTNASGDQIAEVERWNESGVEAELEAEANARLFAAAPDLLNALEAGRSRKWVHNAAITQDIEALRRIALEHADWWNIIAMPLIERLKGE